MDSLTPLSAEPCQAWKGMRIPKRRQGAQDGFLKSTGVGGRGEGGTCRDGDPRKKLHSRATVCCCQLFLHSSFSPGLNLLSQISPS